MVFWAFNENTLWVLSFSDVEIITYIIYGTISLNFYNWQITSIGSSNSIRQHGWQQLSHSWVEYLSNMLECCSSTLDIENTYMEDKSFQETLPLFILEIKIRQVYLFLVMGHASRKKEEWKRLNVDQEDHIKYFPSYFGLNYPFLLAGLYLIIK